MKPIKKIALRSSTFLSLFAVFAGAAQAQNASPDVAAVEDEAIEAIVVTGSRIARPELEASSPVSVISGDQFLTFNSPSAERLLAQNPQFLPNSGPAVNNGNPGAATVDLRGLGDYRTLVLVDGKRMVAYDYNGIVDINAIPTALIKRVDVLSGGASAVYGSDAVSGVVNFVLDDEFTGLRFDGSTEVTQRGDGQVYNLDLTGGIALGDRGNIVVSGGYLKRKVVFQSARNYSAFALSSDDLVSPGGSSTADPTVFDNTFANSGEDYYQVQGNSLVPYYAPYNYAPPNYLITPQERYTGTVLAKYAISDSIEIFGRGSYIRSKVDSQSAPTGTFGYAFDIFPDNPFLSDQQRDLFFNGTGAINPDGSTRVGIRRRITESGGRTTTYDNEAWQIVGGLRGDLGSNLRWEAFGQYARTTRDIAYLNDITYARVAQALDARLVGGQIVCRDTSNGCLPLDLFSETAISPDVLGFITAEGAQKDKTEQWVAGASLTGDLFALSPWAPKPIGFAVGVEYRKEKGSSVIDAAYASGDLIGYGQGQSFPSFSFDVKEVFGELIIPLVEDRPFFRSLNVELGARYSDYSTVGGVFSWKAGGDWSPIDGLRFRGMYQRSVRAPNLYELSAPVISGIDNLDSDPCAGTNPVGNASLTALCIATGAPAGQIGRIAGPVSGQINAFFGGNPDLSEEKSDTITLGVVVTPPQVPGLSLSVDYYDIKIKNAIDALGGSPQNVVNGCFLVAQDINSPYCQAIARNTLTGSLSGDIAFGVQQTQFNSAVLRTKGIDVGFNYARDIGNMKAALQFNGTFVDTFQKQGAAFVAPTECAGRFGYACNIAPMPKWKHVAALTLGNDDFTVTGRWRLIGKVQQDEGTDILRSRIGAQSYFDLTTSWDVVERFTLRLGVTNLLDKSPPIVGADAGSTAFAAANTFPAVYDPLGRTFFAGVTAKF